MRTQLKTVIPAEIADLKNQIAELTQLREKFEADNAEAIEKVVKERVATLEAAPTPSDEAIEEQVKTKVAAAEATFTAERDAAIAAAVAAATSSLEADLATVRAELAAAASATPTADSTTAEELNKVKSEFEATKKSMLAEFEQVKTKLSAEAKAREKEITDRLTAEVKKAAESSSGSAPPVDVDALIKTKLDALEGQRAAAQKKAIEEAVAATVKEQEAITAKKLADAKTSLENEAKMRTTLLTTKLKNLETKLRAAQGGAPASTLPAKPAPASASASGPAAASTPAASPPASTNGAASTRGKGAARGGARGGRGGGADAGRGGGAAGAGATSAAASTPAAGGPPSLSLRGAAGTPRTAGGVLGNLLAAGGVAKRPREGDDSTASDSPKKPKGGA